MFKLCATGTKIKTLKMRMKTFAISALVGALCLPFGALADVTLSYSNHPADVFDAQVSSVINSHMTQMLEHERASVQALETDAIAQILANFQPKAKPTPPMQVEYTRSFLAELPQATGGDALECLTEALYFEARGESVKGQFAVAEVILNRV